MSTRPARLALAALALTAAVAGALAQDTGAVKLEFVNHLQAQVPEQDVFVERAPDPGQFFGQVFRVTGADKERYLNAPLYAAANPIPHNPFDAATNPSVNGPFDRGRSLGLTLGRWLEGKGSGSYECVGGRGTVRASFESLVPGGVYTMWYSFLPMPPTSPFTGNLDLPLGARDGSQTTFRADASGKASFQASFQPCLQLSSEQVVTMLAAAYHSDGKTHGSHPGPFGSTSHVQLFAMLPAGK